MNFLVSYKWLREYVDLKEDVKDFSSQISLSGPSVEKIIPQGVDLDKIFLGKTIEVKKHPNADKLNVAQVDIGQDKMLNIVCGGKNLKENQYVAVAVIGAKVRWHGEGDLVELEPIEIRGVASEGMICASNEIGLAEAFIEGDYDILDLGEQLEGVEDFKLGTALVDVLSLNNDYVMDIEVTSNRPDAMGIVGMAREASAILKAPFLYKEAKKVEFKDDKDAEFKVNIEAREACDRYIGARIKGVQVKRSPWWLKRKLLSAGIRPINNLVDITNYVLLELGQPMHVFDTKKLSGTEINIRFANNGEKIVTLDGEKKELSDTILVITDDKKPIAIAGVMGGEETGVQEETVDVILEAATFDPVIVRRGARKVNLQSDSQLRFEKGLSMQAPEMAMNRAIELVLELAGGEVVYGPIDEKIKEYIPLKYSISLEEINKLIGVKIDEREIVDSLDRLGFTPVLEDGVIRVIVPWWRDHDIESARDLVEEVARIYGYGKIPAVVPVGLPIKKSDQEIIWEDRLKDSFKGLSFIETFSYSFLSKELLAKAGYNADGLLHIKNPLNIDLEVMRSSLLPQLLQAVVDNQEKQEKLSLFELSKVYLRRDTKKDLEWDDLPDEVSNLSFVVTNKDDKELWRSAKGVVEYILRDYHITDVRWVLETKDDIWHPGRAIQAYKDDQLLATVGEVSPRILDNFKIEERVGAGVIEISNFIKFAKVHASYKSPLQFPISKRDLAILVDRKVYYHDIEKVIKKVDDRILDIEWFDTYQGDNIPSDKKSIAMHLIIGSKDKTLDSNEIDGVFNNAVLACEEAFKAEIRK